ncbi:MAG: DUF3536 domain-containing protein [Syntrophobacteraceae bacterium]
MSKPEQTKYVCIHGHFYQPPRENPWLEAIEREDSAAPYHDWNERIHFECYRANTAARLVDDRNRILTLRNNYELLSFNFGPTLFRWIEQYDPWVHRAIVDADRSSCERLDGHGNAMAQVYSHMIMPLANRRDKITQVAWGIRDFERRFGRRPEGMWLAETAVDRETLQVLAEAGIKFTVLSPFQAARWRFPEQGVSWQDVRGGKIPTGRPYRYDCGDGRAIALFFYDGEIARGVAYERVLEHSSKLVGKIDAAYERREALEGEAWLVHAATDGESYGHHFKFGDMALAAALRDIEAAPGTCIINYGAFLASFPARAEVEIIENTAWSCAHGLGRWTSDCGCHIGGEPGWNQKWRGPLRAAMNRLRDSLAAHYELEMARLCKDPWKERDEYIDVLLDPERLPEWVRGHCTRKEPGGAVRFLQLLEMERYAMLMFTSCGWFFDEISGLETVLVQSYAARAIQLARQTGAPPGIEDAFIRDLEHAPSNRPEYENGARVYLKKVKSEAVGKGRVAASYAIQSLGSATNGRVRLYAYDILPREQEDLGPNPAPCLFGHAAVRDRRTLEQEDYLYSAIHFGGLDFRCSVKPYAGPDEYASILKTLQGAVEDQDTVKMIRIMDEVFGDEAFSLHDVLRDMRSSIALEISRQTLATFTNMQRHLYSVYRPLMASLRQWDISIPEDLRGAVGRVLSDELKQLVQEMLPHEPHCPTEECPWDATDFFYRAHLGRIHSLLENARAWSAPMHLEKVSAELGRALVEGMLALKESFTPGSAGRFMRLVRICIELGTRPEMWKLQTLFFELVGKALVQPALVERIDGFREFVQELDRFLECRFFELLDQPAKALVCIKVEKS